MSQVSAIKAGEKWLLIGINFNSLVIKVFHTYELFFILQDCCPLFFLLGKSLFFLSACINSFYIKKNNHLSVMFVKRVFHHLVI